MNLQETYAKREGKSDFPPSGHLKFQQQRHGQQDDAKVYQNVDGVRCRGKPHECDALGINGRQIRKVASITLMQNDRTRPIMMQVIRQNILLGWNIVR